MSSHQQKLDNNFLAPGRNNNSNNQKEINGKNSINTIDTHYSQISSDTPTAKEVSKNRTSPFKKIKQCFLSEKNNQGKIIKQRIQGQMSPTRQPKLERLDDAITIFSNDSPKSNKSQKFLIDQSIIILSSQNVQIPRCYTEDFKSQFPGLSSISRRRYGEKKSYSVKQSEKRSQSLKTICKDPTLAICQESGLLVHYEHHQNDLLSYENISNINSENVLKIFGVMKVNYQKTFSPSRKQIKSEKTLVFYQPFQQTLTSHLLQQSALEFNQFINWILQIANSMIELFSKKIYVLIDPTNVVLNYSEVKIILRPHQFCSGQTQSIRSFGTYVNSHLKQLTQTKQKMTPKSCQLKGIDIFKRIQLRQFFKETSKSQNTSIKQIIEKLKKMATI